MLQERIEHLYEKNLTKIELMKTREGQKPYVVIVSTNKDDEPSERYMKKKLELLAENGCKGRKMEANDEKELETLLHFLNNDKMVTGIIIQAPFGKNFTNDTQKVFDLVNPSKDIDRLHSKWYYDKNKENLPLTAMGMYDLINEISEKGTRVLFYGNGLTTNKRLFLKMFDEGKHECRVINSKTPNNSKKEMIEWADIIVSSTGIPNILECEGKFVISPTICKTEEGFRGDLRHDLREVNKVHKILGGIGKLTTSALLRRAYEDVENIKTEEQND